MKLLFVLALALTASAVTAQADLSMADKCMYNQVVLMSDSGQKLAFQLTKTEVSFQTASKGESSSKLALPTEGEATSRGGWAKACQEVNNICSNKRGKRTCKYWRKACVARNLKFEWTVAPGVIENGLPTRFTQGRYTSVDGGNKRSGKATVCTAFQARKANKVCLRRDSNGKCIKTRSLNRENACLKWKTVLKRVRVPAKMIIRKGRYAKIVQKKRANFLRLRKQARACRAQEQTSPKACDNIESQLKAEKKNFRSWRKAFSRRVRGFARQNRVKISKKSYIRQEKKFAQCKKRIAALSESAEWTERIQAANNKRIAKISKLQSRINSIKSETLRQKRLARLVKRSQKSERRFKARWSKKIARASGCARIYNRFRRARNQLRRATKKASKRSSFRVRRAARTPAYKVKRSQVRSVFTKTRSATYMKKATRVCVKRMRKWSSAASKFACISTSKQYPVSRCAARAIGQDGKYRCTQLKNLYGARICTQLRVYGGVSRCLKNTIAYPRAECVKSIDQGEDSRCTQLKFYTPIRFCRKFRLIKGSRKCVSYGAYFSRKYYRVTCAGRRTESGKCLKYKTALRSAYKNANIKLISTESRSRIAQRR